MRINRIFLVASLLIFMVTALFSQELNYINVKFDNSKIKNCKAFSNKKGSELNLKELKDKKL